MKNHPAALGFVVGDDIGGQLRMDDVVSIGRCRFTANAGNLAGGQQMTDCVIKVFNDDGVDDGLKIGLALPAIRYSDAGSWKRGQTETPGEAHDR
jgi:hypothetical protein